MQQINWEPGTILDHLSCQDRREKCKQIVSTPSTPSSLQSRCFVLTVILRLVVIFFFHTKRYFFNLRLRSCRNGEIVCGENHLLSKCLFHDANYIHAAKFIHFLSVAAVYSICTSRFSTRTTPPPAYSSSSRWSGRTLHLRTHFLS